MVTITDFQQLELIVAEIKEVVEHPQADRLYLVKVDTGTGEKQLVAGIRTAYTKEALIGRQIVMINNLEPAIIRGEKSEGMLLAAGDPAGVVFITPEKKVVLGSRVK
jgi:methionine--tRNA ligase beta chain